MPYAKGQEVHYFKCSMDSRSTQKAEKTNSSIYRMENQTNKDQSQHLLTKINPKQEGKKRGEENDS